jgi:riboflavin synthase
MFTGLVEQMGQVQSAGTRLAVRTPLAADLERGDSIAVNGVCLTAVDIGEDSFEADVMEETLVRSTLGRLTEGERVNLELALRVGDRLGGHFVQGHVDATGRILDVEEREHSRLLLIGAPPEILRFVVEKGSIAVDGVSLTVTEVDEATGFRVSLIPETLERTTLGSAAAGDPVNLEVDMLAKYAVKAQ